MAPRDASLALIVPRAGLPSVMAQKCDLDRRPAGVLAIRCISSSREHSDWAVFERPEGGTVEDKSGVSGPSYLVGSWLETCDWIGRSYLTVFFLCTAIGRFCLHSEQADNDGPMDEAAPAASSE